MNKYWNLLISDTQVSIFLRFTAIFLYNLFTYDYCGTWNLESKFLIKKSEIPRRKRYCGVADGIRSKHYIFLYNCKIISNGTFLLGTNCVWRSVMIAEIQDVVKFRNAHCFYETTNIVYFIHGFFYILTQEKKIIFCIF